MGLLSKLLNRDPYPVPRGASIQCQLFEGDGDSMEVVGESQYQDALRVTWDTNNTSGRSRRVDCYAVLQPQPNNPYDPNAVAVHAVPGGLAGYLSRDDARKWHTSIAEAWKREGMPIAVPGRIVTRDGDLFGIWLDWPKNFTD